MKTGRRSFLKLFSGLVGAAVSAPSILASSTPVSKAPLHMTPCAIKGTDKITFVLDIPGREVKCQGFRRASDGELHVRYGTAYADEVSQDGKRLGVKLVRI
jgi:hypothetical protein